MQVCYTYFIEDETRVYVRPGKKNAKKAFQIFHRAAIINKQFIDSKQDLG